MPKIIDACIFFNEVDLLDIRFNELNEVVDEFIVIESRRTFTNKVKPLNLLTAIESGRFNSFRGKVKYIIHDPTYYPDTLEGNWSREVEQRNYISKVLDCNRDDLVIVSDADEIPRASTIKNIVFSAHIERTAVALSLQLYHYYVNYRSRRHTTASFICQAQLLHNDISYQRHIAHTACNEGTMPIEKNAGWHFSYLGGPESIKKKMEAFSHQEYNTLEYINDDNIAKCIATGEDIFHRDGEHYDYVDLDETFPLYLRQHREDKFAHLIGPQLLAT